MCSIALALQRFSSKLGFCRIWAHTPPYVELPIGSRKVPKMVCGIWGCRACDASTAMVALISAFDESGQIRRMSAGRRAEKRLTPAILSLPAVSVHEYNRV